VGNKETVFNFDADKARNRHSRTPFKFFSSILYFLRLQCGTVYRYGNVDWSV